MYSLERYLVTDFLSILQSILNPFDIDNYTQEFDYRNGRVDIVATNSNCDIYAFEAKLNKFRIAMNQAYRNTSFAHYSYVVLPEDKLNLALKYKNEFIKRRIGLCSVSDCGLEIVIKAKKNKPLQPWLTKNALILIKAKMDEQTTNS